MQEGHQKVAGSLVKLRCSKKPRILWLNATKKQEARQCVLQNGPQRQEPEVPEFSPKGSRVRFAKEFRCGHWQYWKKKGK